MAAAKGTRGQCPSSSMCSAPASKRTGWPRVPFAAAIALGDPGSAAALAVEHEHGQRPGSYTEARLVRADGSSGAIMTLHSDPIELPVPEGTGPVWLLLTNAQAIHAPGDYADPAVLRIDALEWR